MSQLKMCLVSDICELTPMANSEKAWCWSAQDFSEEAEGQVEKLAARFNSVEAAKEFKAAFDAAKTFNTKAKAGDEDLVWAETVEDVVEVAEDDIDTNKTAEGGDDE